MDLLQQLKESHRNSLDLPDLVHQLLLRSGASTGPTGTSGTEKLAKCRSFTEGADAVWQEDRHSGLAARLRVRGCQTGLSFCNIDWAFIHDNYQILRT